MTTRRQALGLGLAATATLAAPHLARAQSAARGELQAIWLAWPDSHVTPVLNRFREGHPNITLREERLPFNEVFATLEVRLNARQPTPDLYLCDGPLTASYAVRRHLAELDGLVDIRRYNQAAREQGSFNGRLMSLPLLSSSQVLLVNRTLFQRAGIPVPSSDVAARMTWEQVQELALRLTNREAGIWGMVFEQAERPYQILALPQSMGGVAIGPDSLTTTGFIDSPAFVRALTWYQEMYTRHRVSPPNVFDVNLAQELFGTGRAAMFLAGPWNMEIMGNRPNLDFGVVPHPSFAGGRPVTPTGAWHVGLNPRSRNREAAEAFIRAFHDPAMVELQARQRPNPPVMPEVWDRMGPAYDTPGWRIVRHEVENTAVPRPATPGWREYEDILRVALREITNGAEVAARLQRAARDIDREMQKYRG